MPRASLCLLAIVGALAGSACRSRPAGPPDAGPADPAWPGLTVDLTPDPGAGEVAVALRLSGPEAARVTEIDVARAWADTRGASAILHISARDGAGDLPLRDGPEGGVDRLFLLARPARGDDLVIRYRAHGNGDTSRFGLHLSRERASGIGHAFLLLPRITEPLPVRIRWHLQGLPPGATAATSFGAGAEVITRATSEDLGQAAYLAGTTRVEEPLPSPAPIDDAGTAPAPARRLVVLGAPAFDTRAAFYWSTTALETLGRFFDRPGEKAAFPYSFLLIAEPGMRGDHDGAALTDSFALWFDASRSFDAGLKSVVAHELTHRYVGGALHLEDESGEEAVWFSEGFTVHLARRWLLESGMVTPRDVLPDLRRTTEDPTPGERFSAACSASSSARSAEEYRRGARYAALTDVAIQKASKGERGIDDLVHDLLARARGEHRDALPTSAWREAIQRELGDTGGATFDRLITKKEAIELPGDAFGPCFRRVTRQERVFDLGFDRRSLDRTPAPVSGVVAGSVAAKAGLRNGALVLSASFPEDVDPSPTGPESREVVITVAGKRGSSKVRYRPWTRRGVVRWETQECAKRR